MVPANAGVEACFSRAIFWHCFQSSLKEKELGALDQVDGSTEVGEILEQNMVLLASKIIENQKLTIQNIYAVWIENLVFAQKSAIGWRRYISEDLSRISIPPRDSELVLRRGGLGPCGSMEMPELMMTPLKLCYCLDRKKHMNGCLGKK